MAPKGSLIMPSIVAASMQVRLPACTPALCFSPACCNQTSVQNGLHCMQSDGLSSLGNSLVMFT